MAAAAETAGDLGGVAAGDGADRELGGAVGGFPQGGRQADACHGAGEIGDVVHIVLGDADFLLHAPGDHGEGHRPLLHQLHMLHDPALDAESAQGVGLEQLLVQFVEPGPGSGALGRRGEGVLRGVGEPEAAGIRGEAHIHRLGKAGIHGNPHALQNVPHQLGAGGAVGIHSLPGGEGGGAAVVVDAQRRPIQKGQKAIRQHSRGGHIHGDQGVPLLRFRLGEAFVEPLEPGGDFGVGEDMAGFAQAPQPQAQCRRAAQGVPVGTAVGQQQVMVMGQKKLRRLSSRQLRHGLPPES